MDSVELLLLIFPIMIFGSNKNNNINYNQIGLWAEYEIYDSLNLCLNHRGGWIVLISLQERFLASAAHCAECAELSHVPCNCSCSFMPQNFFCLLPPLETYQ